MFKKVILVAVVVVAAALVLAKLTSPAAFDPADFPSVVDSGLYDVTILRDTWGVPHIFGKRDSDAAYGLAFAHAEDDFVTIQNSLLGARGTLAAVHGRDMAPNDFMAGLFRIRKFVDEKYETDLSPEVRAVCEGYAAGLNQYARLHPSEVLPTVYPFNGRDIVAGFVHKTPLFFGAHTRLAELFEPERKHELSEPARPRTAASFFPDDAVPGSNSLAVSPLRSENGETFLAINSHQPWEGPVAWYEAHLHSEEGLDIVGGVFPGTPVILHGHNRSIGWAHTVNHPDLIDIFVLQINPENKNQYMFDGEWLDLEVDILPINVRLLGFFNWTIDREILWSVYGPVVRQPHGTYAIRFAGLGDIRHVEQWFRMNKAESAQAWREAMRIHAIPMFNSMYADKSGEIGYVYNARLPIRAAGFDWNAYLPGDGSHTLWRSYLPWDSLPQIQNPPSGFLQNCNNAPWQTTDGPGNPDPAAFATEFGIDKRMTNRALRAMEQFGADSSITETDFHLYKYDMAYSASSPVARYVQKVIEAPEPGSPLLREAIDLLSKWDLRTNPDNRAAALAIFSFAPFHLRGRYAEDADLLSLMKSIEGAAIELKDAHGRLDVPWQEVNRLVRGDLNLGIGGAPDVLHAIYADRVKGEPGVLHGLAGECYILMVKWDRNGQVTSESIHQFGSATRDKDSKHYADQAPLFAERKLKPVWMNETDIRANLEREYRPAELKAAAGK